MELKVSNWWCQSILSTVSKCHAKFSDTPERTDQLKALLSLVEEQSSIPSTPIQPVVQYSSISRPRARVATTSSMLENQVSSSKGVSLSPCLSLNLIGFLLHVYVYCRDVQWWCCATGTGTLPLRGESTSWFVCFSCTPLPMSLQCSWRQCSR